MTKYLFGLIIVVLLISCNQGKENKSMLENNTTKGKNHPRFKYYYHTPYGIFDTPTCMEPVLTASCVKHWCIKNPIISKRIFKNKYLTDNFEDNIIGKRMKDIGFYISL